MDVSGQQGGSGAGGARRGAAGEKGPRARMRRLMLNTASRLMQAGATPSVSEVAEAAAVSRATAYRYFPSQAALVAAVVEEALGPILRWQPGPLPAEAAVADLVETAMPRIEAYEATFRAALRLTLERGAAARKDAPPSGEAAFTRGHRMHLLGEALRPLEGRLPPDEVARLAQALSLLFGVEALVVLKDIWKLGAREARDVVLWAARALVRAAEADAAACGKGGSVLR